MYIYDCKSFLHVYVMVQVCLKNSFSKNAVSHTRMIFVRFFLNGQFLGRFWSNTFLDRRLRLEYTSQHIIYILQKAMFCRKGLVCQSLQGWITLPVDFMQLRRSEFLSVKIDRLPKRIKQTSLKYFPPIDRRPILH